MADRFSTFLSNKVSYLLRAAGGTGALRLSIDEEDDTVRELDECSGVDCGNDGLLEG